MGGALLSVGLCTLAFGRMYGKHPEWRPPGLAPFFLWAGGVLAVAGLVSVVVAASGSAKSDANALRRDVIAQIVAPPYSKTRNCVAPYVDKMSIHDLKLVHALLQADDGKPIDLTVQFDNEELLHGALFTCPTSS